MKKFTSVIVDTQSNLEASNKIIPDGMIAKVSGAEAFKIGDGKHTWRELPVGSGGKTAFEVAQDNGFTGTPAEWLESLKGAQGIQGETGETGDIGPVGPAPLLKVVETRDPDTDEFIKREIWVSYKEGEDYQPLLDVSALVGPVGPRGPAIEILEVFDSIEAMVAAEEDYEIGDIVLIHTGSVEDEETGALYVKEVDGFKILVDLSGVQGIQGPEGKKPLLRKTDTHLQFSYDNENWTDLLPLTDIDGVSPELRRNDMTDAIEVNYGDGNWLNLVDISNLKGETGPTGPKGNTGDPGAGLSIKRIYTSRANMDNDIGVYNPYDCVVLATAKGDGTFTNDVYIKEGTGSSAAWRYLVSFDSGFAMQGPKGDAGADGTSVLASDIKIRTKPGGQYLEASANGGATYSDIIATQLLKPANPYFRKSPDGLQFQHSAQGLGGPYTDLFPLSDITGPTGPKMEFADLTEEEKFEIKGEKGDIGNTGPAPNVDFRFSGGYLEVATNDQIILQDYKQLLEEGRLIGASAYQIAVLNGYKGTQAEWIASLRGAIGPKGNVGDSLKILGAFENDSQLPATAASGDAYLVNRHLYVWNPSENDGEGGWVDAGDLRGLDGRFVEVPKHDSYVVDQPGMLRFFIKNFVPTNYVETNEVRYLPIAENAELYNIIGDKYADKITSITDEDGEILTAVEPGYFVLDKYVLSEELEEQGFTSAICAYVDSLHYNTVGELIFVHENENLLDERIWLRADGTQTYATAFFPEVADAFERSQIEDIVKDNFPEMTDNETTISGTTWAASAYTNKDVTIDTLANNKAWKAFNKAADSQAASNDANSFVSGNFTIEAGGWRALEIKRDTPPEHYIYRYSVTSRGNASAAVYAPTSWVLEGCTSPAGTNWIALDAQERETGWNNNGGETRVYEIARKWWDPNKATAVKCYKYRLRILSGTNAASIAIGELKFESFTADEYNALPKFDVPNLLDIAPEGTVPYFRIRGDLKLNYEGKEGPDSFETMVRRGYTGTYTEWIQAMRGPSGYVEMFTELNSIAELPNTGVQGVGYLIGPDLYVWTGEVYKNIGQWKTSTLYEASVQSGYNGTEAEFNKIIRDITVSDVASWDITGDGQTTQFVLEGCNSNNPESYVVTDDNGVVLRPETYTVQSGGFIFLTEALETDAVLHIREFNHAVNADRYTKDDTIGITIYSLANPGTNFIANKAWSGSGIPNGSGTKLVKKSQYPELYQIVGDTYTLKPEPSAARGQRIDPAWDLYDATANPFPFTSTAGNNVAGTLSAPYKVTVSSLYDSNAGRRGDSLFKNTVPPAEMDCWLTNKAVPNWVILNTGSEAKHRLYKYYLSSRVGSVDGSYPRTFEVYVNNTPTDDPNDIGWIKVDSRTETRHTNGTNTGYIYNVPLADNYPPFAAWKIVILSHFGNNANFTALGRVKLFTIDTSLYDEGFKLSDYFGLPPASNIPAYHTAYLKAKPTVNVPVNYMNEYQLWLSNGHTGTYEQFMMTRTIEPEIAKAFHGNMSTLVKRFDFNGESLNKVQGYRFLVSNKRAKYHIRYSVTPLQIVPASPHLYIRAVNGTVVDNTANYMENYYLWSHAAGVAGSSGTSRTQTGFLIWGGSSNTTEYTQSSGTLDLHEDGYVTLTSVAGRNPNAYNVLTSNIIPWANLTSFELSAVGDASLLFNGFIEIYEEKTIAPVEMHSKEVILEKSYFQQPVNKEFAVDYGTEVELSLNTKNACNIVFVHDQATIKGSANSTYAFGSNGDRTTLAQVIRNNVDNTVRAKIRFQQDRITVTCTHLTSMADAIETVEREYFITPAKVFGKTYSILVENFTGTCKIAIDKQSHSISSNPDAISGLNLVASTTLNTFTVEPGTLELDGALTHNYQNANIHVLNNIGDREVLDKTLPIYVYGWQSDVYTKTLEFQCSHSAPNKDRYNNSYTDWTKIPNGIGMYYSGSDKIYRLIGVVRYKSLDSEEVVIQVPTFKQDYNYNLSFVAAPTATTEVAGSIKLSADPLDFSSNNTAVTPYQLQNILAQNTVQEFSFIGNGTLNEWELDGDYQPKDLLVLVGETFVAPSKYRVENKLLKFVHPIPDGIEINVRPMFASVNAYSDVRNALISGRLSMYILNNAESL